MRRIAHFEHLALLVECHAFAAQCGAQIMHVQDPEAVLGHGSFEVSRRLAEGFIGFNDVVHGVALSWNKKNDELTARRLARF